MYKSFRVQNFRGFKDLCLDDFARVNLIAGKNNTGKSALLEAIFTYTGEYDASRLLRAPIPRFRTRPTDLTDDLREWRGPSGNLCFTIWTRTLQFGCVVGLLLLLLLQRKVDVSWKFPSSTLMRCPITPVSLDLVVGKGQMCRPNSSKFKPGDGSPVHLAWSRRFYSNTSANPTCVFKTVFIPSSEMVPRSQDTKRFSKLLVERRSGKSAAGAM